MRTLSCGLRTPLPTNAARSGAALIIVLAFVVLLTGLMVAFFARSISDRQIANSSAIQTRTDIFAQGAVSTITGDLKQEIAAGSTIKGTVIPAYLPSPGSERLASQPYAFSDTQVGSVLLKRSANTKPFYAEPSPQIPPLVPIPADPTNAVYTNSNKYPASNRAAPVSTSKPSTNGRFMTADRWNKPQLFADTANGSGFPTGMIPDWIMVARDGSNPVTAAANSNVVGRFAYTMYDESALLDANVAGGGAGLFTSDQVGKKGNMVMADLTQLSMTSAQINALLGWRNGASAGATGSLASTYSFPSPTNFYNFITQTGFTLSNPNGFLTMSTLPAGVTPTTRTDQFFTSRQGLLRFLTQGMPASGLTPLQLRNLAVNLGTFTRERNAPSWMPKTPVNSTIDYATNADNSTSTNRNVPSVAVLPGLTFTRVSDGTTTVAGEPLIKYRFPLYRLGWFNDPKTNAANILKYFCMKQSTDSALLGQWEYYDPDTNAKVTGMVPTIKTLFNVAMAKREPTFWETLQAAILSGSLGAGVATAGNANNYWYDMTSDTVSARSILRIGLCLIDQYDTDDDPTVITLGTNQVHYGTVPNEMMIAGEENLPYFYMFGQQIFPDTITSVDGGVNRYTDGYHQFLLWNPHRAPDSANVAAKTKTGSDAVKFAIHADGQTSILVGTITTKPDGTTTTVSPQSSTPETVYNSAPLTFNTTTSGAQRRVFDTMDIIKVSDLVLGETNPYAVFPCVITASGAAPTTQGVSAGAKSVGFIQGQMKFPKAAISNNGRPVPAAMTYTLGKFNASGQWVPYLMMPRVLGSYGDTGQGGYTMEGSTEAAGTFWTQIPVVTRSDPRTMRFGWGNGGAQVGQALLAGNPSWNMLKSDGTSTPVGGNPGDPIVNSINVDFASNVSGGTGGYYKDPDSVVRRGDGAPVNLNGTPSVSLAQGNPFCVIPLQNDNSRPTILNRAFTSVAEMGYAFRDSPWRTINFFSKDSADGGLLDFFSLNEEGLVRAGVFNLNRASQQAMAALLCGAYLETIPAYVSYLDAVASAGDKSNAMAKAIRTYLGPINAPLHVISNAADLPFLNESIAGATGGQPAFPSALKAQREVLARAFGDVTNTRTWNLLIDVVAQTGRYGSNAKTADQFNVEGEKRLWVHLAIDRYTGQVIDSQIEPVTE